MKSASVQKALRQSCLKEYSGRPKITNFMGFLIYHTIGSTSYFQMVGQAKSYYPQILTILCVAINLLAQQEGQRKSPLHFRSFLPCYFYLQRLI